MQPGPAPAVSRPPVPIPASPSAPGAYVPPMLHAEPSGPPAPARAWAGQAAAATAASKADQPRTSAGDLLDATRVTEFVGWLAVAGSAMAAVGFLLPWGVSVIGATGIGYFDRWGLAGPFHPIVLLSLLAMLGLSLVRNPVPLWLRVGVLGSWARRAAGRPHLAVHRGTVRHRSRGDRRLHRCDRPGRGRRRRAGGRPSRRRGSSRLSPVAGRGRHGEDRQGPLLHSRATPT